MPLSAYNEPSYTGEGTVSDTDYGFDCFMIACETQEIVYLAAYHDYRKNGSGGGRGKRFKKAEKALRKCNDEQRKLGKVCIKKQAGVAKTEIRKTEQTSRTVSRVEGGVGQAGLTGLTSIGAAIAGELSNGEAEPGGGWNAVPPETIINGVPDAVTYAAGALGVAVAITSLYSLLEG